MKQLLVFAGALVLIAMTAQAQDFANEEINAPAARGWTCDATGFRNTGGPGNGFSQTVRGYGNTQLSAAQDAMYRCTSFGLQRCMVGACFRR